MKKEGRTAAYDGGLRLEACRFEGIARPFPNHFHEYYVIGLVEKGERVLSCGRREYAIQSGHILLFNPGDSHACVQSGGGTLDYRALNIAREVMLDLTEEITGRREPARFSSSVILDEEAAACFRPLHELVMTGSAEFGREERLLLLAARLIREYGKPFESRVPDCREEVEKACAFMEERYAGPIRLDEIARHTGLSKSTLLRAFAKAKGVTPYSYLESVRVGRARKLLEQGVPPVEAALRTGFSDQSHFTGCFSRLMGLSPGSYREIFRNMEERSYET